MGIEAKVAKKRGEDEVWRGTEGERLSSVYKLRNARGID